MHAYGETDDRTNNTELAPWLAALQPALEARRCALAGGGGVAATETVEEEGTGPDAADAAAEEKKRIDALAAMWLD